MTRLRVKFPHIVKAGNAVVKIYRGKAGGYDFSRSFITVMAFAVGTRSGNTPMRVLMRRKWQRRSPTVNWMFYP